MAYDRVIFPLLVCVLCFASYCAPCSMDVGQTLDLSQFAGKWYFIAGTSTNLSLSSCGWFLVKETTSTDFVIRFRGHRHKSNIPVVSNIVGKVDGNNIVTYWRRLRSRRKLGPFYHVIISVKYDTAVGMLVCTETKRYMENKLAMIWSRERSLPLPILEELKSKLGAYVNQEIRMADHDNC
ncbi:unnamed protein product [Heterotrigona itama]|uniref:Lipocalin/cytosolic fatty-acid binding domain-containing protein n=1 Tax=Heterotrigona itama TaxID=395501 RepID=A0A6V7GRV4_9HYME|nr:unnamed protein product [Heterotrigona itama]